MGKKLFVGNVPYSITEDQLKEIFSEAGTVESVAIITDKMTGRPRGFVFVEMSSDEEAAKAVEILNGKEVEGRELNVNEARPREEGGSRGGYGGGNGGGYGGGRSY
ncbi:RNA-binding protein [Candidatus Kaiserbacteria bacterium CG10_big_fil_rev_8_21_14_0_10_45_20]|uniref:RNA-binding protein n=1 Tax=Candidatus Kaiserbacteria bacterium CG10_big_fil_rev_8_21_14_0_10_45_20 TaxID=1974607 RepID=A0A2H0UFR1_9BACT|nr:MAG: RNA-binding protein [Candidatus Kaiserbacteria bacterium CG10_big_fil_rev_8_21_14_0_10_45_20]